MPSVGSCLQGCVQSVCGWMGLYSHLALCVFMSLSAFPLFSLTLSLSSAMSSSYPVSYIPLSLTHLLLSSCPPLTPVQAPWCRSPCGCCMPSFLSTWPSPRRLWTACTVSKPSAMPLVYTHTRAQPVDKRKDVHTL